MYTKKLETLINSKIKSEWTASDTEEAITYLEGMFDNDEVDRNYISAKLVRDLMNLCCDFYSCKDNIPYPSEFYSAIVQMILNYKLPVNIED